MNEYLLKIMGTSVLSIVLVSCLPTKKVHSLIKNIVRLCLYLIIIAPIASFCIKLTKNGSETFFEIFSNYFSESVIETDEVYIKYCSEKSLESTERALAQKILEEYQVLAEVEIILKNAETLEVEKVFVTFTEDYDDLIVKMVKDKMEAEYMIPVEILKEVKT